ncbi:MAG: EAL domain-containing protein [Azoarcus sp.]|nr:EAL domain-containing protein [Azoarcus sp.]
MRIRFRRLQWRIAAWFALILLTVQLGGLALFAQIGQSSALADVNVRLETGDRVFSRLLDQRSSQLTQAARVLAADYGFREALLSRDSETIESALENHGSRIDASLMLLLGLDEQVMERYPRGNEVAIARLPQLIESARSAGAATGFSAVQGRLYQLVVVPVLAPVPVAWVVIGFVVDVPFAEDLKRLTGLEVSFLLEDESRGRELVASTLSAALQQGLIGVGSAAVLREGSMRVDAVDYVGLIHEIATDPTERVAAVLQISLQAALAPWQQLYREWAGLSIVAMILMLIASVWMGRTIASPVTRLAQFARRVEAGEYGPPPRIESGDEIGQLADAFAHMTDAISSREARISELAYRDALTGLPNRVHFLERVGTAMAAAAAEGQRLAVLTLDIDRFKLVNDTLGHGFGDLLLREVAQRLRDAGVRKRDVGEGLRAENNAAARLGGDEFAVLVPGADAAAARVVAARIASALEQPMNLQEQLVDVRASIGIAIYPDHCADVEDLMRSADVAMYHAKRNNSGVEVYDPADHTRSAARLSLLTELRRAVEGDELVLYYQPKHAFRPELGLHVEALVRWVHPQRGFIPPMEFIPFAEQTGYIKTITLWVMNNAIRQCAAWQRAGREIHVGLNISARDLLQPDLPLIFRRMLDEHGCEARLITLELTESAVLDDPRHALANLERLRETGCMLSIDDYGTGYSSLSYVRQMPVHELKIDRSFVMNLTSNPGDEIIVRSTIELAHDMGLMVTAEGVETEDILLRLGELGCDLAQGYLISRPVAVADLEVWLRESPWAVVHESAALQAHDDSTMQRV